MPGFSRGMEEDEVVAPKAGPNRNRVVEEGWDSTGKADGGGGGSKHSVADGHLMPVIACYKDNSETCVSRVGESVEDKEMGNMEVGHKAQSNLLTSKVFLAQKGVVDLASSDGPSVPFISEKALVAGASSTGDSGKDQEGNPSDGQNQHGSKHTLRLSMDYLATFVTGILNVTPIITLVLGLIVRRNSKSLESLAYGTCAGKIKLVGIMLSIGGVMLLAFFKRVEININVSPTKFSLLPQHYQRTRDHNDQVLGLVLAIIAAFSNACFLTIQAKFKEDTQNIYLIPFMMNLMGAIQGVVYAIGVERDWEQWKLGWNIRFWASSFVGVFGSGLTTTLITWCISEMGPLFVSTFNPIGLILMALVGSLVLQETLYVTSVAAIVLIIAATLLVLYGKLKEMDNTNVNYQSEGSGSEENEDEVVD
ncbi:hypothetical protein RHGRI_022296 [Rhododendron griersonianum]|uniref:EamA domain-containing protein n=1 Tax=Rhododendron griersonianum TaxID=479676 RepID=A0AAV6IZ11_9ERIC|nr:hypothetical protein RHGRI_022296 [Rhododendron griersonianum]